MTMKNPEHEEWHTLFSAALNGTMTDAEKVRLAEVLKSSAEARALWFLYNDNECSFSEMKPRAVDGSVRTPSASPRRSSPWFQWRPLMAAAAGLVIGLCSASLVWGYAGTQSAKAVTLLRDSFESGSPPQVNGVPVDPGHWSGDYSEVLGEHHNVKPAGGQRMLRFLRADYAGKTSGDGYIADVYRLIDLNDADLQIARGDASVSVEASFRALSQEKLGRVLCNVTIHALDALPTPEERHDLFLNPRDGVAVGDEDGRQPGANILATATRHGVFDSASGSWHLSRTELLVPPGTRYLMVHLHEWLLDSRGPREPQPVEFAGLYVDDVRVTLIHRPALP